MDVKSSQPANLSQNLSQKYNSLHLPIFYKEMYLRGQRLTPGIHFYVNIGKFGVPHFREDAMDFYETSPVCLLWNDKFVIEDIQFCFNEIKISTKNAILHDIGGKRSMVFVVKTSLFHYIKIILSKNRPLSTVLLNFLT